MTIRFTCPDCDKRLKVDDRHAGRPVDCPRCGTTLLIPAAGSDDRAAGPESAPPAVSTPARAPVAAGSPSSTGIDAGQHQRKARPGSIVGDDVEPPIRTKSKPLPEEELDLTPMVDVTFQLLIFFMLTAAFALQKSIDLPTPDPSQAVAQSRTLEEIEEDDDYVIVRIEDDNIILLEDKEISRHEIVPRLRELREKPLGKSSRPPNSLMVMASGNALHETVVLVLDAGSEVGMENVRLSTQDDEE